jgi:hypothetical protein
VIVLRCLRWPGRQRNVVFVAGHEAVFSPGRRYRAPVLRRLAISVLVTAALLLPGRLLLGFAIPMAAVAAACAVIYLWQGRFRTVLSGDGIRVHGYFSHFVPWAEVAGFDVVRYGGPRAMTEEGIPLDSSLGLFLGLNARLARGGKVARLATVAVVRVDGRRLRLRAPRVTAWQFDPEFDNKIATMERWRREHSVSQRPPI